VAIESGAVEELVTTLYTADEIRERVEALGRDISEDYAGREPVLISILKGGMMFHADLLRATTVRASVDFMSISKYGMAASGVVRIMKDLDRDILDQDVIVIEDIVDTGLTLTYLLSALEARQPASLHVCALLDKSVRRITPLEIRYRGFDCPDKFVIGYGLDYAEVYRNLPFIAAVEDLEALERDPLVLAPLLDEPAAS
jgi:hypoxanthine phosphoribosyltransferase